MHTPRFVLEKLDNSGEELRLPLSAILPIDESHHLIDVLRIAAGSQIEVVELRSARCFLGTFLKVSNKQAEIELIKEIFRPPPPTTLISVGLVQSDLLDFIVEKSVEIGVSSINFFAGERSQYTLKNDAREKKIARLKKVAVSTIKQSGTCLLPNINIHSSFKNCLSSADPSHRQQPSYKLLLLSPENLFSTAQVPTIPEYFARNNIKNSSLEQTAKNVDFHLVVGPEGGFSREEIKLAQDLGYQAVSLGTSILRTETAVVAGLATTQLIRISQIKYEVSEMQSGGVK